MRDYEKLVKWLRSPVMWDDDEDCVVCEMLQDDAADAIEELLAAVPRWISVEERLPDVRHSALVTDGEELYLAYYYYGLDGTHHWDSPFQPTHWMPLPNPPGGERK